MAVVRSLLVLVFLTISLAPRASAWSENAHRAVARVASELAPETATRRQRYLIGSGVTLEDLAGYLDSVAAERPEVESWREITLPPGAQKTELERDCPVGDCVTAKVREFEGIVRLGVRNKGERLEAFKLLIGLAAELHQPLNAGYPPDRGGDRTILVSGKEMSLYELWDQRLLGQRDTDELAARIRELATPENVRAWSEGTLRDWTWDTHRAALEIAYDGVGVDSPQPIDARYLNRAQETAEIQLAKAAVRLAVLLDRIWP